MKIDLVVMQAITKGLHPMEWIWTWETLLWACEDGIPLGLMTELHFLRMEAFK